MTIGFVLITAALWCVTAHARAESIAVQAANREITNSIGMTLVRIEPGTFMMGSPESEPYRSANEPQHEVTLHTAFYMQQTEVTLDQWRKVMPRRWFLRRKGPENLPVTRVSYWECKKFVEKLSRMENRTYRLPTEQEWEYACRAGTTSAYSFGDTLKCSQAMYGNNSLKCTQCRDYFKKNRLPLDGPAPVASYPPNPWGLYDMHGNVWEWTADPYHGYFRKNDGVLPEGSRRKDTRIRRGGSWFKFDHYCRSANRAWAHPAGKFKTTGFRVVLEVAP